MVCLTIFKCDILGFVWNHAHTPTLNEMSDLLAIKYI